jgi:DNA-directed RNA polymerase sigma subunit (sigma70/sigma32)
VSQTDEPTNDPEQRPLRDDPAFLASLDDASRAYLAEIESIPPLTAEQESALRQRIAVLLQRYARQILATGHALQHVLQMLRSQQTERLLRLGSQKGIKERLPAIQETLANQMQQNLEDFTASLEPSLSLAEVRARQRGVYRRCRQCALLIEPLGVRPSRLERLLKELEATAARMEELQGPPNVSEIDEQQEYGPELRELVLQILETPAGLKPRLARMKKHFAAYQRVVRELVAPHLRLVPVLIKHQWEKAEEHLLTFQEMVEVGNRGLVRAAEFSSDEDVRFAVYATWWIRQSLFRALSDRAKAGGNDNSTTEEGIS